MNVNSDREGKPTSDCQESQPSLGMTQLHPNLERSEELKKKKKSPPLPPEEGAPQGRWWLQAAEAAPFMTAETEARSLGADWALQRQLSQSDVWEAGPFMKAVAERKLGAGERRVITVPVRAADSPSRLSRGPSQEGPSQGRLGLEAEGQAPLSGSASRAGPGSQTLPPSVNWSPEVIFFPLLIEIICFQFPDKFIEFLLRLGPLSCTI